MEKDPDNKDYHLQIWEKEYNQRKNLPSTKTDFPSRALRNFLEEIDPQNREIAVDIGSGNGRNSIYLAQQGYKSVIGYEFVENAVNLAIQKTKDLELDSRVKFYNQSVGENLEIADNSVDLVIDMMVMHSLTKEEREVLTRTVQRILNTGGYFVFYTIAAESEAAKDLMQKNVGPEENSYRFKVEDDWITEKAFTKDELISMFPQLKMVKIEDREEFTPAFGDVYKRLYYYGVFRKPN
jgi:SAM-dependent methyltransferase